MIEARDGKSIDSIYSGGGTYATTDFSGAASIYFKAKDYDIAEVAARSKLAGADIVKTYIDPKTFEVNLPLFVTNVSYDYSDIHRLNIMMGGYFTSHFQGKRPIILQVNALMLELENLKSKRGLMGLYRDFLRFSQVARHRAYTYKGKAFNDNLVPHISFTGCQAAGAFLGLTISENAQQEDMYQVSFPFLVFEMWLKADKNMSRFKTRSTGIIFDKLES